MVEIIENFIARLQEELSVETDDTVRVKKSQIKNDVIILKLENQALPETQLVVRLHKIYSKDFLPSDLSFIFSQVFSHVSPLKLKDFNRKSSFLFENDAIRAVVKLVKVGEAWGRTVDIASGEYVSMEQIYQFMFEIANWHPVITEKEILVGKEVPEKIDRVDCSLYGQLAGFIGEMSLKEGLKKIYEEKV